MRRRMGQIWSTICRPSAVQDQRAQSEPLEEPPLSLDEDPFESPVVLEIRDVLDLHAIPPAMVRAVVEEYLREARQRGFSCVRLIHGKGMGVQRAIVRSILERTEFVDTYRDASPSAGGWGATLVEFRADGESLPHRVG